MRTKCCPSEAGVLLNTIFTGANDYTRCKAAAAFAAKSAMAFCSTKEVEGILDSCLTLLPKLLSQVKQNTKESKNRLGQTDLFFSLLFPTKVKHPDQFSCVICFGGVAFTVLL